MIRIVHVITGLDTGGAEMMLSKLVGALDRRRFDCQVISLTDVGPVGERIRALGIPTSALGMRRGIPEPTAVLRLALRLRAVRPDIVQTWMYHADLIGGLAARAAGIRRVLWGIRASVISDEWTRPSQRWLRATCARLSHVLPIGIVSNSEVARRMHIAVGYAATRMLVIPNGFDTSVLKPDPNARHAVRQELGIFGDAPLVGLVGRFDPQKDHRSFVRAAAMLARSHPDAMFLLCGDRVTLANTALMGWIDEVGMRDRFRVLGRRDDIPRLGAALDLSVSASVYGEAFPNVIGEAMACGVPCVVTDVGDSGLIVGETGRTVPAKDPSALARACRELLDLDPSERARLGAAARQRIETSFSLSAVAARFAALYEAVVEDPRYGER